MKLDPLPSMRDENSDGDEPARRKRSVKSRSESSSPQKTEGSDPEEPYEEVPVIPVTQPKVRSKDEKAKIWIARCSKGGGLHDKKGTAREIGSFCHSCAAPWAMKDEVVE